MSESRPRRRGLGGLTPEKKAKLKKIIMDKVKEEMHVEAIKKKEAKDKYITSRMIPLDVKGKKPEQLKELCQQLKKLVNIAEEEKYDLEQKLNNQEREIHELTVKIQLKGKFTKPVLRKVKRTDTSMLAKIRRKHQEKQVNQEGIIAELHHVEKPI